MRQTAALLLLLSACGSSEEAPRGEKVDCLVEGATDFERVCTVERRFGKDGLLLTLRNPDGGFRRLLVTTDGRGVTAADGAEPAVVRILAKDAIEVTIGGDRYRLPATVR